MFCFWGFFLLEGSLLDQSRDTAGGFIPFRPVILQELIILMALIPFHPMSWSFRVEAGKGHGAEQD